MRFSLPKGQACRGCCLGFSLLLGCGNSSGPSPIVRDGLGADVIARVGDTSIVSSTVQRIAAERGLAAAPALDLAISDAVFAEQAERELARVGLVTYLTRLTLARALLNQLKAEATGQGAASDDEITALVGERWWEFEQPELFRTTHAVVITQDAAADAAALGLAQKIRAAVEGVSDPKEFRARVDGIDAAPLKVKVENLTPVARDGRAVDPKSPPAPGTSASTFDLAFAEAAANLSHVGELSPVVHSKFGYHVLLLTEIIPAKHISLEERRSLLQDQALVRRAQNSYRELLDTLRANASITIATGAQALMASVQKQP